ncbi:MAG TPA: SDR family NAD(P)-dependent oxidoreductase [Gemmatimonadales bacterium]
MRFRDKTVLISGGSRGIGLAAANLFATEGARVVLASRNAESGAAAVAAIPAARFVTTDVRVAAACERAVHQAAVPDGLQVLINNAGVIYRDRDVGATTEAEWDETFEVNVKGAFLMSKYALPALRASRGTIVNVASYVGLVGFAGAAAYSASKAALVNLTRTMALDHAEDGIRVNCVCPGSVATDMIFDAWAAFPNPDEARLRWEAKHPLRRIATPEEVAKAIVFLASDDATFITGVALPVDGGITAG